MASNNKQLVSVRLSGSDLARIKRIAARLRVRESDVIRFALKTTLMKLSPLHDDGVSGSDLLPVFMELGPELAAYFDIDAADIDSIVNGGIGDNAKRVALDDLALLTMVGIPEHYLYARLRGLVSAPIESIGAAAALRQYLYSKYFLPAVPAQEAKPSTPRDNKAGKNTNRTPRAAVLEE